DRQGKTVATFDGNGPGKVISGKGIAGACYKMADGRMICLASGGDCIRLDAEGKVINRIAVPGLNGDLTGYVGNLDVTSKGNILIVHNYNTVVEYEPDGKIVWQAKVVGNRATRLANGNTLVASETTGAVVEIDNAGKTVWRYQSPAGYKAVRAR